MMKGIIENLSKGRKNMFTIGQIGSFVIAAIGLTLTIMNIIDKSTILKERAARPLEDLTDRVRELETWKMNVDQRLADGVEHFKSIDESNKVIQKALLALMDNAMDENIDELKNARKVLYDYLAGY